MKIAITAALSATVGLLVGFLFGSAEALENFSTPELVGELNWRGVVVD